MTNPSKSVDDPKAFYGYLFKPDKGPTETMGELLTGIGRYIQKNIGDPEVRKLTPAKLAEFYKAVGGNYDPVFLEPPHDRISFIYASLGCQHTLQPGENDYEPPKIPALTLKGFVRWQSIETLLGPEEHVPYLQYAVEHFEILRYDNTTRFPTTLPAECLPTKADDQVMKWHEDCSKRLWKEYITPLNTPRGSPRPRSHTGPPGGTPMDNMQYKYAYAHVKMPLGNSFSAASSPRMRPAKEREDYFNSKPVPTARRSRPTTAESFRTREDQRKSEAEEYEDIWDRGRRRSVPKNYYNTTHNGGGLDGSDLHTPGRATSHPSSPRESRPHADSFGASAKEHYARRHSHPRHAHAHVVAGGGSSDEEGEAFNTAARPPSPHYSNMRGVKSNVDVGGSAASHRLSRESQRGSATKIPDLRYEAASPVGTPSSREGRRYSPKVLSGFGAAATGYGNAHARAYSGLDVPAQGKARIYKVHSADEKTELRHKHSTSTSGGSRSNSREDREAKESRRSGGVRWVKDLVGDALPFGHRRHSDSPPLRDRDDVRREDGNAKYRREDMGSGRKDRSSDEERRRVRKREEASRREREYESGRRQPEVRPRY